MTGRRRVNVGVGLPNFGPTLVSLDAAEMARAIEDAGFDGVWLTDHIALPTVFQSQYPYSANGASYFPSDGQWFESVVTLGYLAAATHRVELGVGVCVLPLRDPRLLSKQLATIDRLAGGRVILGGGAGWLAEEFAALEVPFDRRGRRLEGAIDLIRACWAGEPAPGRYGPYELPVAVRTRPQPAHDIPILLAGVNERSLRRIATHGDGWLGAAGVGSSIVPSTVGSVRRRLVELYDEAGRDPSTLRVGLRLAVPSGRLGEPALADELAALADEGVDRFVLDFGWRSLHHGGESLAALAETVAAVFGSADNEVAGS